MAKKTTGKSAKAATKTPARRVAAEAPEPRKSAATSLARKPTKAAAQGPGVVGTGQGSASELITARIRELRDWRGEMLALVRGYIHEADPAILEEWKWGTPVWSHDGIVCTGETYKQVVKLTFARGASLADPSRLFNAGLTGNARRAIDLRIGDGVDGPSFRELIREAVAFNQGHPPKHRRATQPEGTAGKGERSTATGNKAPSAAAKRKLLAGGNPQIAKADGDAPVRAYVAAMPGWKGDVGRRLDALIVRTVPGVRKAVKWNTPFYGIEGRGWFLGFHCLTKYLRVAFFRGTSLRPLPPGASKSKDTRYLDIREDDPLDEELVAGWIRQASELPGRAPQPRPEAAGGSVRARRRAGGQRRPARCGSQGRRRRGRASRRDRPPARNLDFPPLVGWWFGGYGRGMSGKPYDATLKDLTDGHAADWARLLGPWPVTKAQVIDADVSTVSASGDKALRVDSDGLEWVLHLEPQSAHKLGVPRRVWWYNSVYHQRTGLLVRSVLLLLRPQANASDMTGEYALRFPGGPQPYSYCRYEVVRAWELGVERILGGGLGTLPLAPLTDEAAPALQAVLGWIDARLRAEAEPEEADKVRAATGVLMGLRYPQDLVRVVLQGASAMWEKVLEDSSVYQGAVKLGEERGLKLGEERGLKAGEERGLKAGEERGLRAGEVRGAREVLLALGTERFGPPDAATLAALEALSDLPRLRELARHVLSAPGWQELLG